MRTARLAVVAAAAAALVACRKEAADTDEDKPADEAATPAAS